ncbi:MAG: efflux RND transporter permease subunit [Rhodanobacter sp.]
MTVHALLTLLLLHASPGLFAFVGIIMLIGIAEQNTIMLIDFALERQREEGVSPAQATSDAGRVRIHPIMMTTLAAMPGTLSIALDMGAGAETRGSVGLAVVGEMVFSQILTLYQTPVIYLYMDQLRQRFQGVGKTVPAA